MQEFLQNNSTRIKRKPKINLPRHLYFRYLASKTAGQCNLFCRSFVLFFLSTYSFTSLSQDQLCTYMITVNPATRSCLPRPIVNLWWKLWLPLKFARHFIFWWSRQSSHDSWRRQVNEMPASLPTNFAAAIPSMHSDSFTVWWYL